MKCELCRIELDQPGRTDTRDCGGDCLACMADCGDPDAMDAMLIYQREVITQGQLVVEDFMRNIANCALQNYSRLNLFMIDADRLRRYG